MKLTPNNQNDSFHNMETGSANQFNSPIESSFSNDVQINSGECVTDENEDEAVYAALESLRTWFSNHL